MTVNDLDRHRKCVHRLQPKSGSTRLWRCASADCKDKDKIWPRLDNFRSHLKRMHKDEDTELLVAQ